MEKNTHTKTVVFILPSLAAGGAERVLITLMNNVDRRKLSPHFVALDERGPLRSWVDQEIPFHSLGQKRIRNSYIPLFFKLKKLKPDIVITTMAHVNFLLLLLKPFFHETRFIVREANVPHSLFYGHGAFKSFLIKTGYKRLYPYADVVISPAKLIVDEFERLFNMDTSNHFVLYNPVDIKKINAKIPSEKFSDVTPERQRTINFVCAGRLHHQKGFDRLIAHLDDLSLPENLDWHITILGEGKEEEALKRLLHEKGLDDKVSLRGLTDNPWLYMAQADCFLLPSRWEGLPNVVLESLACGTPVIAMREAGGIEEIADVANKQEKDVIRIADTMENFIDLMGTVRPLQKAENKTSFLPDQFSLEQAVTQLETLFIRT